ncbi:MAG TPA: tetratricopeptide repeat protein, partial [Opitutus sp.]|nr:tetratricopeptide repeat protein [Opitutus sp.]
SQVRLAQKNAADAVALAVRATELDATKPAHFSQLGIALSQRIGEVGFIQKAIISGKIKSAFTKALELDANDLSALIGLARFYTHAPEIAGGSLVKARELAERVRQLHPFRGELELGHIAAQGEQPAEALKHFEAAARLQPNSINAHYSCGQMLAKLGRKEEARARFETVLKISAGFEPARKSLAALGAPSS